jgi:hypothetical protein
VSRVRVWHPEFGYVGTSSVSRPFMAFVVCGLFAGAISVAIFNPEPIMIRWIQWLLRRKR